MASKKGASKICLPGEDGWQLWERSGSGPHTPVGTSHKELTRKLANGASYLGIPIVNGTAVPIWANSDDKSVVNDIVSMQLETQGLTGDIGSGKHQSTSTVATEAGRTLTLTHILDEGMYDALYGAEVDQFSFSPEFYAMGRNELTIWKELGKIVFAVTREGEVVYYQCLASSSLDREAFQEIKCSLLTLHAQNVITKVAGVSLWTDDITDGVDELFTTQLGFPLKREQRPTPMFPTAKTQLLPHAVADHRDEQKRSARTRRWLGLAALLYLILLGFLAFSYINAKRKYETVKADVDRLKPQVSFIEPTRARWDVLQPAVDGDRYPLELFLRVSELLPPQGVRFRTIAVDPNKIYIQGESSSSADAIRFQRSLSKAENLQDYEWNIPPPKIDSKKNITTFQATGKYKYGNET